MATSFLNSFREFRAGLARLAFAAGLVALLAPPALAGNETVSFKAQVAPGATMLVQVFSDAVLLPAEPAGNLTVEDDDGKVKFSTIAAAPHHVMVQLNGQARLKLSVCASGTCQRYLVVRAE